MWLHLEDGSRYAPQWVKKYRVDRQQWLQAGRVPTPTRKLAVRPRAQHRECWLAGNPRPPGTRAPASRPPHSEVWRTEPRLSAPGRAPRGGVPLARRWLGPDSVLHTSEPPLHPTLAASAFREHTWSSSLMSMNAGTLMAKAGALRTLGPQTTLTGKRSWAARRRLTTASGSACAGLAGRGHQDGRSHGDQSQRPLCGAGPGGGGSGSGTSPTGCLPAWSLVSSNSGRWGVVCVPYYRPACASRGPPTLWVRFFFEL